MNKNTKIFLTSAITFGATCIGLSAVDTMAFEYIPEPNDCWTLLVDKFGYANDFDLEELLAANGATIDSYIYVGIPIEIPDKPAPVEQSEIIVPTPVESVPVEPVATNIYYAEYGDGWYAIAEKNNTSVSTLLSLNNATLSSMILVGQPIIVSGESNDCTCDYDCNCSCKTEVPEITYQPAVSPVEELIGSKTLYSWCDENSWYNVCHAADLLNGVIVEPDEIFSWYYYPAFRNQCGFADGFIAGGAFSPNGSVNVAGGGICFPSTVFYQCAVFECGMTSIERHNHIRPVSYATQGTDAAISLSTDPLYRQDMKFQNTTGHRVRFDFAYDNYNRSLTVSCYKIS